MIFFSSPLLDSLARSFALSLSPCWSGVVHSFAIIIMVCMSLPTYEVKCGYHDFKCVNFMIYFFL